MSKLRKRGTWSVHELERLKDLWNTTNETQLARVLGRSLASVRRRAGTLFSGLKRRGPWNAEEDRRLRLGIGVTSLEAIARGLGRSVRDTQARLTKLRSKQRKGRTTPEEISLLKRVYGTRDTDALELVLARPRAWIERLARELCLGRDKRAHAGRVSMPRWSEAEVKTLARLYPNHDNLELARTLHRSVQSVANKAWQLGLEKSREALVLMGHKNIARRWTTS